MKRRILVITFNANTLNSNLINVLVTDVNMRKILDTTWLVRTTLSPAELYAKIEYYINKENDRVFIADVSNEYQGWLSRTVWEWIKEYLDPSY